jgi:hypothetical protein
LSNQKTGLEKPSPFEYYPDNPDHPEHRGLFRAAAVAAFDARLVRRAFVAAFAIAAGGFGFRGFWLRSGVARKAGCCERKQKPGNEN